MNEARKTEQLQPIYPQYIKAPYVEDEINLVDVWVSLLDYKKIFFAIFTSLLVIGLFFAFFIFNEKYMLTSAIQIGTVENGNAIVQLETTESVKSKLSNVLIPSVTNDWLQNIPEFNKIQTSVSSAKGSDIVLIQNKIKQDRIEQMSEFQNMLSVKVILDHEKLIALSQSELLAQLETAKARLKELEDPKTLQAQLDKLLLNQNTARIGLIRLQDSHKLYNKGGQQSVLQLLTEDEREQLMTLDGNIDHQLLNIRYEQMLLDNRIRQDEQNQQIQQINLSINDLRIDHAKQVKDHQRLVNQRLSKIEKYNKSRVISEPVISLKPSGLTRNKLIIGVILLAGFAGILAMLVVMFRDKVRQRLQEK